MRIQGIFGTLLIFIQTATGLLFQDPAVCRFTESNQCYVGLGRRLHLQMPLDDGFELKINNVSITKTIIKYRKHQSNNPPKPAIPQWQFVHVNKTMILTSAERIDSGTYTLELVYADGTIKDSNNLQLYTEAEVSSVRVWYSCLSSGVVTVYCSADGDNFRFNWTSDLNTLSQLENHNSTLILDQNHHGNVTCHVENHISHGTSTVGPPQPCPEPSTVASTFGQFTVVTSCTQSNNGFPVFVTVWLFEVIILLSLLVGAFYIYTRIYSKLKITENQEDL